MAQLLPCGSLDNKNALSINTKSQITILHSQRIATPDRSKQREAFLYSFPEHCVRPFAPHYKCHGRHAVPIQTSHLRGCTQNHANILPIKIFHSPCRSDRYTHVCRILRTSDWLVGLGEGSGRPPDWSASKRFFQSWGVISTPSSRAVHADTYHAKTARKATIITHPEEAMSTVHCPLSTYKAPLLHARANQQT